MNDPQMATLERCLPHLFLLFTLDVPNSLEILSSVLLNLREADLKSNRPSASAHHINLLRGTMIDIKSRHIGPRELEVLKTCICFKRG